jgi:hypothetical protein
MEHEIAVSDEKFPLTANAVIARVRRIQEIRQAVMKKDVHYGVIPGCQKQSLYKPGAEVLLMTFRIAAEEPKVEDLSTGDAIRYRVTRNGAVGGHLVASGIGECSSDEEKYKWRFAVCEAEYEKTPEDRRREKFKRDGSTVKQVRTNPADVANTILKMADKRAYIAMTILATAASDMFGQDLEDLPPEVAEGLENGGEPAREPIKPPQAETKAKSAPAGDGLESIEFVPSASISKPTKKEGQTRYAIKGPEDAWWSTFDDALGAIVLEAREEKAKLKVTFKREGEFRTIVDAERVQ